MVKQEGAPKTETLIFDTPEEGQAFTERAAEQMRQNPGPQGIDQRREVVGEELAKEFEKEGEAVDLVKHPWEHTQPEHQEVQQLVNLAFEKNLKTAIDKARGSDHYPRNLDLLHDVLTTEMYKQVADHGLDTQATGLRILVIASIALAAVFIVILLFIL